MRIENACIHTHTDEKREHRMCCSKNNPGVVYSGGGWRGLDIFSD